MMGWAWWSMPDEETLQRQRDERALQDSLARIEQELQLQAEQESEEPQAAMPGTDGGAAAAPEVGIFRMDEVTDTLRTVVRTRSEEHTSELQSRGHLVCRLLLEKKKTLQY